MNRLLSILILFATSIHTLADDRPNILLIFLDDLGYADVGFNAELNGVETDIVTPHIDALAKNGTVFRQAYVAHPFCGPSRMALMSGRMPHCFGGQKNLPNFAVNLKDYNQRGIPESETLMSSVLRDAGYFTGCVGKWHLGYAKPFHPNTRGFDEFFGFLGGGHQYFPWLTDKVEPKVNDYQYFLERNGEKYLSPDGVYLTDLLSNEAVNFIDESVEKQKPFFLYLAYNAPHSPLQGDAQDLQKLFPDHPPENPQNGINFQDYTGRQNYIAMMYAVDRGIAQIKTALDKQGILENTLIVFLSDNGGKILQAANNAPLQDDKGSTLEGGIRVPMFMHWPQKLAAGTIYEHPVNALDFYPTFSALAEAKIPEGKILDGKNIIHHVISGENSRDQDEAMIWVRHHGVGNEVAIRIGDKKAYRKNFAFWKTFDLSQDIGETENLAKNEAAFLEKAITYGAQWGATNVQPLWHDTNNGFDMWQKNQMPQYDRTFQRR